MKEEDKELLLRDLCARLPYQPMCEFTDTEDDFCTTTVALGYSLRDFIAGKILIKPYLRPMSSMTEEERKESKEWLMLSSDREGNRYFDGFGNVSAADILKGIDWLNSHHFDYRGLIEKDLALEAPKDMYKN